MSSNLVRGVAPMGLLLLVACGGGGASSSSSMGGGGGGGGGGNGAPTSTSVSAASATAANNSLCTEATLGTPFYWEIGNATGPLVSGVQPANGLDLKGNPISASGSNWSLASASKWVYAAYVVQKRGGPASLDATNDIPYLNFTSGYVYLGNFPPTSSQCDVGLTKTYTVDDCLAGIPSPPDPTQPDPSAVGHFDYDSDHMEWHASKYMMLGADMLAGLQTDIQAGLAAGNATFPNLNFQYSNLLLAGGIYATADDYTLFLREILSGDLKILSALGADAVCTWPSTATPPSGVPACAATGSTPVYTASGNTEYWHFSLGHWVEDDPAVGDGSFSILGALGWYAWIDSSKTYYGVIAREDDSPQTSTDEAGFKSTQCGRLIRAAWMTGHEQTGQVPGP